MSKQLIIKKPLDQYLQEQRELDEKFVEWRKLREQKLVKADSHPRMTKGIVSRWDHCESYANYDQMRWGPDPIDSVIDRLGVFEGINFSDDIAIALERSHPTTWITRTGTQGYDKPGSPHYQASTVKEFERHGLDASSHEIFDSAPKGSWCTQIRDYIGLDEEKAHQVALREYG